jgi:hypothetical protein
MIEGVNLVRIYLLVLGGVPVCTGIVVFSLSFTLYELLAKDPFAPLSDLGVTWVFGAPAAIVLYISLRAHRRVTHGEEASGPTVLLAKLVPLLMILGVGGGVWATYGIIQSALHTQLDLEKFLCDEVLTHKEGSRDWLPIPDDKQLQRCLPEAHVCERERRHTQKSGGWNVHPDRDQRPEVICLRKAGRAAGWLK